jgi:hypothetical protein
MIAIGLLFLAALIATAAGLAAEGRPHMKSIDVSPARHDRGEWVAPAGWRTARTGN